MSLYEKKRAQLPLEELQKYAGQWVAISLNGNRIVASAETIAVLEERLAAAGIDPQNVGLERIEFEASLLGGVELL